jgi:hypothetical protein
MRAHAWSRKACGALSSHSLIFGIHSVGRQAYIQGSGLAVWEVMLLVRSYRNDLQAVAKHLRWPYTTVQAAVGYAEAFSGEIDEALAENEATSFAMVKRMLPQAVEFIAGKAGKR